MKEIDFSECSFIEQEMQYYTFKDFCQQRRVIKKLYNCLSKNGKIFYHYYVYANIHMKITFKNKIWDYLNDYANDDELLKLLEIYKII